MSAVIGTDERPLYVSRWTLEAMREAHTDDVIMRETLAVGATGLVLYDDVDLVPLEADEIEAVADDHVLRLTSEDSIHLGRDYNT